MLMYKPIYLGFSVLDLSKWLMYEKYFDKLLPYFGQEILKLHYMGCDGFVQSFETQNIINHLKNFEDLFDFSNLKEKHELLSIKKKKVVGKFKLETP